MNAHELLDAYAGRENPRAMPPFQLLEAAAPKAFDALRAVLDEADKAEHGATRWADPLPVPEWVDTIRTAITTALETKP